MELRKTARDIIAQGYLFGRPTNLNFNPNKPYVSCMLCGAVFQGPLDLRVPPNHEPENSLIARLAKNKRDEWAEEHATQHTEHEHMMYRLSGRFATPEAAQKLAALGTFSVLDLVIDDEVSNALAEAKAIPIDDVEDH